MNLPRKAFGLGMLAALLVAPPPARAAGNVTAEVDGGKLVLEGDDASNDVVIYWAGLAIKAGSGDDSVDLTGTTVDGTRKIDLGGGINTLIP